MHASYPGVPGTEIASTLCSSSDITLCSTSEITLCSTSEITFSCSPNLLLLPKDSMFLLEAAPLARVTCVFPLRKQGLEVC